MADLRPSSALTQRRQSAGPARLESPRLVLHEVERLCLFALTADFARHDRLRATVEDGLAIRLPTPGMAAGDDPTALWQGPEDILFVATDRTPFLRLQPLLANEPALLHDVSTAMSVLELSGPGIAQLCAWTLQGAGTRVGQLAGLRVTQHFMADGSLRLFVPGCDADYLWAWIEARLPTLAHAPA